MAASIPSSSSSQSALIFHITRFKIKSDADPAKLEAAGAQLHNMGRKIASMRSYSVGKDVGGAFDLGAFYSFDDLARNREYLASPIHRKVDEIGLPLIEDMASFDIVADGADPRLADQIKELHRARYEGDEELAKLVGQLGTFSGSGFKPK